MRASSGKVRRRRRAVDGVLGASLLLLALAALGATIAHSERAQRGNLIVSLSGGISPRKLPRDHPAPVAVQLRGSVRTADDSPPPRTTQVELALSGHGLLFTRGLAVCPRARLRNSNDRQALTRCGHALVGRGRVDAQIVIPEQTPLSIHGSLLAFNGRTRSGSTAVWIHAFVANPPVSVVLPVVVHRRGASLHTTLVANISKSAGPYIHLAQYQMTFSRRFTYRGRRRSYLSASCPVPPHFTAGFLSFARATYSFAEDRPLEAEAVRSCRARPTGHRHPSR